MTFNTNRWAVATRVVLLALLISASVYCLVKTSFIIVPFILILLSVLVTIHLVFFIEKTNRDFTDFLLAIKNSDFGKHTVSNTNGKSFARLKSAQNMIIERFQQVRLDNEAHYFLLQTVVEHVKTAIIAYNETGHLVLLNESAKTLLQIPELKNISSLKHALPALYQSLVSTTAGNNPILELEREGGKLKLLVKASDFSINHNRHKLISITNIETEIDHAELLAWEKLIHVLTHEIMNSITPVSSLSSLLKDKAEQALITYENNEQIRDIAEGLNVIEKRSNGLVDFVNNYKALTVLPKPELILLDASQLFLRIKTLKHMELTQKGINFTLKLQSLPIRFLADQNLVEQVLINLLNNAADACAGQANPEISLLALKKDGHVILSVKDNGAGIPTENLGRIFIPFFTTKKTGSGIGLSLSKQILRLHKGTIFVTSSPGKGTEFTMSFPVNETIT